MELNAVPWAQVVVGRVGGMHSRATERLRLLQVHQELGRGHPTSQPSSPI